MRGQKVPPKYSDPVNLHGDEDDEEDDEEEELDLLKVMSDMKVHERRNVYALKGLLNEYKKVRAQFREELAQLEVEHLRDAKRFHDIRTEIVCGIRDVTDDEVAAAKVTADANEKSSGVREISSSDDDESRKTGKKSVRVVAPQEESSRLESAAASPNGGVPDFWLTAMCNSEVLDAMITERDRPALSHLRDITLEHIDGDPRRGFLINFHFAPNEYFDNAILSKKYTMEFDEDSGELEIDSMVATPVDWKSREKNLTVILKKRKQRHKNSKATRVVTREEQCPSFFNFFTNPFLDDEDSNEEQNEKDKDKKKINDDDEDECEEKVAELHIEMGQILMEELIPKAAFYYTGKSVEQAALELRKQLSIDDDDDDDDDDETDDEKPGNCKSSIHQRGTSGNNREGNSGGGRAKPKEQKECKQQ
uniref:Putative nucleosome assembly protein-like protein n=1 Tax=Trypanosoma congolense (strain IL3000) TaxID=1068625 RepID=G0UTT3_TRYCI|nr:putative nucleosome assembly protein-like protein [Trypanosoma congolense IL3000]